MTQTGNARARSVLVFAWLEGQTDNLGDSFLRRAYADRLRSRGSLRVWAGRNEGYLDGLQLRPGDVASRGFLRWLAAAAWAVARGRACVALNAGQFGVSRRFVPEIVLLLPLAALCRVTGQPVVWLGAAVPSLPRGTRWLFRWLSRTATLLRWRDTETSAIVRAAPSMPDWAFALGDETGIPTLARRDLAISLRGDRPPPSDIWLAAVRSAAAKLHLRVVVVVQVARDREAAQRLAQAFGGAPVIDWSTDAHYQQERMVRLAYGRAAIVLSDRLHALVAGITEGAVPLAWTEHTTDKIRRHFEVLGADWVATSDPVGALSRLNETELAELSTAAHSVTARARAAIDRIAAVL